jgi:plastocyanin
MRSTTFFGILAVITASASLMACGSDTTSGTTGTGGSTGTGGAGTGGEATTSTSTTSTSTTSTSTTSTSSSSTTSTSTGGSTLVNGCDPMALEDHTKDATVEIKFGDPVGFKYSPPCIKVKSGTMVTFKGSTNAHPLAPGEIVMGTPVDDPKSPIKATSGPATVTFAISPAGSYPYYCTDHYSSGMKGLIVAE